MAATRAYKLESELCDELVANLPANWTAYPEALSYDLLLVRDDGVQLGIQAKLNFTLKLLDQILPHGSEESLPDYLAVLVPPGFHRNPYYSLARKLNLLILDPRCLSELDRFLQSRCWPWYAEQRLTLPSHVANVKAGVPSPKTLSAWKINAIKLSWFMQHRGKAESFMFTNHGQRASMWVERGWAVRIQKGLYRIGDKPPHVLFAEEGKNLIADLERDHAKLGGK